MRVFLLPIERPEPGIHSGDWHAALYTLLSKDHKVVGIERPRWHEKAGSTSGVVTSLRAWEKSLKWGLTHTKDYDIIYCVNTPSACIGLMLHRVTKKPFIWDSGNPSMFNDGKGQRLSLMAEKVISKEAAGIRMISKRYREAYILGGFSCPDKFHVIPHLVDLEYISLSKPIRTSNFILFMGQGATPSNLKAIRWLDQIAPELQMDIYSTGKFMSDVEHIKFLGYVDNIYRFTKASFLGVVPIWRNTGAPVPSTRTFDFMACGRPVVVTEYLLDAIPELRNGTNCYLAQYQELFLSYIKEALKHRISAEEIGKRAKELVRSEYSWESGLPKLNRILEESLDWHQ